jgi:cellulose synthase/poly-beta-1,6-N-acetylglucosamine synthase-like glycosyltransferase
MNFVREVSYARAAMAFSAIAAALAFYEVAAIGWKLVQVGDWPGVANQTIFMLALLALVAGSFAYQVARLGYFKRSLQHKAANREALEARFSGNAPSLVILVPAYKEDPAVVRRTLLSAALQIYPRRRVVLLIDDPYTPRSHADAANLQEMRDLPVAMQALFARPAMQFDSALEAYQRRMIAGEHDARREAEYLSRLYRDAADWFDEQISRQEGGDHSAALLVRAVLACRRDELRERAVHYQHCAWSTDGVDGSVSLRAYRHLAELFRACYELWTIGSSFLSMRHANAR